MICLICHSGEPWSKCIFRFHQLESIFLMTVECQVYASCVRCWCCGWPSAWAVHRHQWTHTHTHMCVYLSAVWVLPFWFENSNSKQMKASRIDCDETSDFGCFGPAASDSSTGCADLRVQQKKCNDRPIRQSGAGSAPNCDLHTWACNVDRNRNKSVIWTTCTGIAIIPGLKSKEG